MIIVEKRNAARAAYWGIVVYCAMSLAVRFGDTLGRDASVLTPQASALAWLADARAQFAAIVAAAAAGYFWPAKMGYPNEDSIGRAALLAPILGLLFLALHNEYGFNLDFWSGLQFGFLAGALIPPRTDKQPKP